MWASSDMRDIKQFRKKNGPCHLCFMELSCTCYTPSYRWKQIWGQIEWSIKHVDALPFHFADVGSCCLRGKERKKIGLVKKGKMIVWNWEVVPNGPPIIYSTPIQVRGCACWCMFYVCADCTLSLPLHSCQYIMYMTISDTHEFNTFFCADK